tara:strand:+ start:1799 stop:1924 length:126 start_codon:yes stop_codon:yes gene_type:complete
MIVLNGCSYRTLATPYQAGSLTAVPGVAVETTGVLAAAAVM